VGNELVPEANVDKSNCVQFIYFLPFYNVDELWAWNASLEETTLCTDCVRS